METPQLSRLVDMSDPHRVFDEVKTILSMSFSEFDFETLNRVFEDVVRLFRGEYPGYRECTTEYHDLKHTTDTFMAMTRLIHGAL
jgi:bifunctional pyridoxal-dependent enzyme with beta-cystathionase and maltose regulon repressor activities